MDYPHLYRREDSLIAARRATEELKGLLATDNDRGTYDQWGTIAINANALKRELNALLKEITAKKGVVL